ncbi:hypothetical protein BJ508DRAFT_331587 [Ascobolus immersus RN42]|uniref:Uncharacterized protein n=1 Tax=Ascobolus immersus RN42 TaxID=1160509 RepID=A0A3N4HQK2_ASCIM|nr:hypothetical protein BJ508DRAFT_331587 [Ascobolus immersus RN42]
MPPTAASPTVASHNPEAIQCVYSVNIKAYNNCEKDPYYTHENAELYSNLEQANASARQCSLFGSGQTMYIPAADQITKGELSTTKSQTDTGKHRLPGSAVSASKVERSFDKYGCISYTAWFLRADRLSFSKGPGGQYHGRYVTATVQRIPLMDSIKRITPPIAANRVQYMPEGTLPMATTPASTSEVRSSVPRSPSIPPSVQASPSTQVESPSCIKRQAKDEPHDHSKGSIGQEDPFLLLAISLASVVLALAGVSSSRYPTTVHNPSGYFPCTTIGPQVSSPFSSSDTSRRAPPITMIEGLPIQRVSPRPRFNHRFASTASRTATGSQEDFSTKGTESRPHTKPLQQTQSNLSRFDNVKDTSTEANESSDDELDDDAFEESKRAMLAVLDKHRAIIKDNRRSKKADGWEKSAKLQEQVEILAEEKRAFECKRAELELKAQEYMVWKEKYERIARIMLEGLSVVDSSERQRG